MSAYDEKLDTIKEEKLRLQYELEDVKQKMLILKKENAKLYESVKQSMEQASMYKTELERDRVFYEEKIAELAKEKAELSKNLDILKVEVQKKQGRNICQNYPFKQSVEVPSGYVELSYLIVTFQE